MNRHILSIDAGYGGCKSILFDVDSKKYHVSTEKWSYITPDDDFILKEFDPNLFFEKISKNARNLVKKAKAEAREIIAISSSSMRHSYVFLDKNGKEVYAGPNTDARGALYQDVIEDTFGNEIYNITGQWPPLIFTPARLLWFKNEDPEKFEKIKYALTTNDWIIYKLCKVLATEPSISSATMLLDIKKRAWNNEILEDLGLSHIELPDIHKTGDVAGALNKEAAKCMDLVEGIPVVIGGSDSQIGILPCHAINDGEIAAIAGISAPVMVSTSKPIIDKDRRTWTSCHIIPDRWVLEANAQVTGANYEWSKNILKDILGKDDEEIYKIMEEMASSTKAAPNDIFAFLGPEIMDVNNISTIRPGMFLFQQPSHPLTNEPPSFKHFVRATLENISFAIKANVELLEGITKETADTLFVTGGLTRSIVWLKTLASITGKKVIATNIAEGTAIGCAIGAAAGLGLYKNIEEASKDMSMLGEKILPENEEAYKRGYERWRELYQKIADL